MNRSITISMTSVGATLAVVISLATVAHGLGFQLPYETADAAQALHKQVETLQQQIQQTNQSIQKLSQVVNDVSLNQKEVTLMTSRAQLDAVLSKENPHSPAYPILKKQRDKLTADLQKMGVE